MTATLILPRMLSAAANTSPDHAVHGNDVAAALDDLFRREPGLRNHVVDEQGTIRPHVSVFVDGRQAELETPVAEAAEIRILHAVSGGGPNGRAQVHAQGTR